MVLITSISQIQHYVIKFVSDLRQVNMYIITNIIILSLENHLSNLAIKSYSKFLKKNLFTPAPEIIFFGEIYDQHNFADLPRSNTFLINNQRICLFILLFTGKNKIVSSNSSPFILLLIKFY